MHQHAMATVVYTAEPIDSIPGFQLWVPGAVIPNTSFRSVAASSEFAVSARSDVSGVEEGVVVVSGGDDVKKKGMDGGGEEEDDRHTCLHCCCGII